MTDASNSTDIQTVQIPANGLVFTVDVAGPAAGPPVLLLHGFPQSRKAWRSQLPALAAHGYRAYAPDQRGYSSGARPPATEDYQVEKLVSDALAIMDAQGAQTFHLVGHDWGGHLAWTIAINFPERVRSLAILSRPHPAAFVDALKNDPQQASRSGHHKTLLEPGVAQSIRDSGFANFRKMYGHQGVTAEVAQLYINTLSEPGAIEAAIEWYRAGSSTFRNSSAAPVTMPMMYVWGSSDATVGRHAAEATARYAKGPFRFVEVPGAGHFLTDEVPARVSELLVEHLTANR